MASGVGVNPEKEIVLLRGYLHSAVEVSGFEPGLEDKLLFEVEGGVHPFKGPVVDLVLVKLIVTHRILHLFVHTCKNVLFLFTLCELKSYAAA